MSRYPLANRSGNLGSLRRVMLGGYSRAQGVVEIVVCARERLEETCPWLPMPQAVFLLLQVRQGYRRRLGLLVDKRRILHGCSSKG